MTVGGLYYKRLIIGRRHHSSQGKRTLNTTQNILVSSTAPPPLPGLEKVRFLNISRTLLGKTIDFWGDAIPRHRNRDNMWLNPGMWHSLEEGVHSTLFHPDPYGKI